jgi:light-regulated signal transduction histidine kinase (bacteriophytochrome)
MNNPNTQQIRSTLESLNISDEDRTLLQKQLQKIDKEFVANEFKINRILKDKEIAINLLNASVLDLEKNLVETRLSYEALEQFSNIASHDLKTPLRSISGYAQLLQRRYKGKLDNDADEFINFIVNGVNHMNDIICDLLEFSRTPQKNQQKTYVDLNDALKDVKINLQKEINLQKVIITHENLPTVIGHQSGIIQLFQNLIANSIKFCEQDEILISISAEKQAKHWQFKISDNGIGIDSAFEIKIFEPFQRLNTNKPGLGMGLAICKKIVQAHGGKIWFQPEEKGGTHFYFTLSDK